MNVPANTSEAGTFGDFLEFETLTLCPIDTRCIDLSLLRDDEAGWLDAYHAVVREQLAPRVSGAALAWLDERTQPV
jgi:Xaa-Pro aminopeptidase